jgi:hypothetical protein
MNHRQQRPGLGAPGAQLNLFGIEAATGDSSVTLSPCIRCGSTNTRTGPGSGPHFKRIECDPCGRWLRWLPRPRENAHE